MKIEAIILHCSGGIVGDPTYDTSQQSLEVVDSWHKQLGFPKSNAGFCIGYNYVIDWNGAITQTRYEYERGCHCLGMNDKSIGILLQGNFDRLPVLEHSKPSEAQIATLKDLLRQLRQRYPNVPIKGHRFYAPYKTCPGRNIDDKYIENLYKSETAPDIEMAKPIQKKCDIIRTLIATIRLKIIRLSNLIATLSGKNYD